MTTRDALFPIIYDEGHSDSLDSNQVFRAMQAVKNLLSKKNGTSIAIPEVVGTTGTVLKRILAFLFAGTAVEITFFSEKNAVPTQATTKPSKQITDNKPVARKPRAPKQDALLVKMEGRTFAETLKTVKQAVDPSGIGVDIRSIKKTKNGSLLLTVNNGLEKTTALKQAINDKIPTASTSLLINKRVLHIKDMDELTTEAEIKDAILDTTGVNSDRIELRAKRPAYGGRQNITAILQEQDAEKLLSKGKIKIGWTMCRVMERKVETKCYRCWEFGHTRKTCNGPNREHLCLKCSGEGHKAAVCVRNPYCIYCKSEGHATSNIRCPRVQKNLLGRLRDKS